MLKLTLFLFCLGVATSWAKSPNSLLSKTEMNLLQVMMDTRLLQRENPVRSMNCFDYYLALFDSISQEYKEAYAACVAQADGDREAIDAATQPERDLIENLGISSCMALKECAVLNGSVEYFSCFASSGQENTENMYEISANASASLAEVRESYHLIETEENRCTNASERAYVEDIYQANLDLQSCLKGDTPVPTTTSKPSPTDDPNTTAAPTDTSTAESDTTSASVEPTTDDPNSTAAPTDMSTAEPDTTSASVEPTTDDPNPTAAPTDMSTVEPDTTSASVEPTTDDPITPNASTDADSSEHNLLPEEDLFAIARNHFAKIRSSVRKQ